MDREIAKSTIRQRLFRRGGLVTVIAGIAICLFIWGPALITPSISRASVRTAKVERASIESTITATGNVVPGFELVISAPFNTRVLKILKRPGARLSKGDPILQLDLEQSALAIEKLNRNIELKKTQQSKTRLDLESSITDTQSKYEIKTLEYKSAQATVTRNKLLLDKGLLSAEKMQEAEIQAEKVQVELNQLKTSKQNANASAQAQIASLDVEIKSLEKERDEAMRVMELGTTKSDRDGVLTWVVNEEGATVTQGTVLARIADLGSFRVEATISGVHSNRLAANLPVKVKINDDISLAGRIARIDPTVTNGAISIVIELEDMSNPNLRSNLRVDAFIELERKLNTLKIKRGQFANGNSTNDVFVIRGNIAIKTPVRFGIVGADHYEILEGLAEGDEVIISEMTEHMHLKQIKVY